MGMPQLAGWHQLIVVCCEVDDDRVGRLHEGRELRFRHTLVEKALDNNAPAGANQFQRPLVLAASAVAADAEDGQGLQHHRYDGDTGQVVGVADEAGLALLAHEVDDRARRGGCTVITDRV